MTLLSDDSDDSSDSAHCPTSETETTNTPANTKGTVMFDERCLLGLLALLGLPSIDIADCSDFAFAAKKYICSKRWSHCPETIVSKGTGTLSVAVGEA